MQINNYDLYLRLFITIVLCLSGFFIPKNKLIFALQSFWLIVITCFNTRSADWLGNQQYYDIVSLENNTNYSNFFLNLLITIGKNVGLSFTEFNGVFAGIVSVTIIIVIRKYSSNPNIVLSLWYIFPFIDNIIQKRAYYGLGLTILAVMLLLNNKHSLKINFYYIILILFAAQIHEMYLYYLTLPIFIFIKNNWKKYFILLIIILEFLFRNKFVGLLNNTLISDKSTYFLGGVGNISVLGVLSIIIWQLAQLCIILYVSKGKDKKIVYLNLWALTLMPLYFFGAVFNRIYRIVLFVNDVKISNLIDRNNIYMFNIKEEGILFIYMLIMIISFILFDVNGIGGIENMVFQIFESNYLLNL
ncbi:EpsG family protein [Limosilactobacillus vaginalis]|uniref:EpsG family protein n=1 Tax=Limosilactobacillus vaginalis TaxID=1633 RepID=UPI0025A3CC25|nr:EpsG family protein [Limosilactobacillus vaginalis]MDM8303800.1 EpsG family protein [Limosilactobacillus vaginalis]